jgi:hypothetical protein
MKSDDSDAADDGARGESRGAWWREADVGRWGEGRCEISSSTRPPVFSSPARKKTYALPV